jgi:hypothetical protein
MESMGTPTDAALEAAAPALNERKKTTIEFTPAKER